MHIKFLDKLSLEQIKDQILQVLNYSSNTLGQDKFNLSSLLSNFSYILHDSVNEAFNASLQNSLNCIIDNTCYKDNINNLLGNNKNSFVLAPLLTKRHMFSTLIYKKDDLFEFILINKASRLNNHSYQKYVIPSNNLGNILNYLGYGENKYCSLAEMYKVFEDNCIQKEVLLSITSSRQKEGNCFFKEIEASLKYAYSNAYIENFKTPKWPMDTGVMHAKFILNIEKSYPLLKPYLNHINSVYLKNKTFRKLCKLGKKMSPVKLEACFKQIYCISDKDADTGLASLDLQTLKKNYSFIYAFCKKHNLNKHIKALDDIFPLINNKVDLKNLVPVLSECSKVFPNVSQQLSIYYSSYLVGLADKKALDGRLIEIKSLLDKALELNPNNAGAYAKRGVYFKNTALSDFKRAIELSPNNVDYLHNYVCVLIKLNNIKDAKLALAKISAIDPSNKYIHKLEQKMENKCKSSNLEL